MKRQIQDRLQEPQLFSVILKYLDDYENINITDFMTSPDFDPCLVDNILSFWSIDIHNDAFLNAARNIDLEAVQVLLPNTDLYTMDIAVQNAIFRNQYDIIRIILSTALRMPYDDESMRIRHLNIVDFIIRSAAGNGDLETLQLMLEELPQPPINTLDRALQQAIAEGEIEIIQYLVEDYGVWPAYHHIQQAIHQRQFGIARYFVDLSNTYNTCRIQL